MARNKERVPAALVSVSVVLTRQQLTGLDFIAKALRSDRGGAVLRALDLLAVAGPGAVPGPSVAPGEALALVRCGYCGSSS